DRAWMTDYFRRHTDEVIARVAPERLLVYEVGEGWKRLCAFLGVPVPDEPYPSENSRAEFVARTQGARSDVSKLGDAIREGAKH
ncbi:MAG TPA: sulfotransferase, partial [Caulobacteraceae bacterium]|nr:sulfotransferase [Caulobacteraceae bacterium]